MKFLKILKCIKIKLYELFLLVKLKCNKNQIHGLNWVLANKVNFLKIHYMVIRSFAKEISQSDFSFGCSA